jgi:hypothetical protein
VCPKRSPRSSTRQIKAPEYFGRRKREKNDRRTSRHRTAMR